MKMRNGFSWYVVLVLCLAIIVSACGGDPTRTPEPPAPSPTPEPPTLTPTAPAPDPPATDTPTVTPSLEPQPPSTSTSTPTPGALLATATPTSVPSRCKGLTGQLEVQILVGPADAVGLEPEAVGSVPFAVTTSEPPYLVSGQGPISYQATLEKEWGTYTVTMDMSTAVNGECSGEAGSEQLDLVLEMTGEQFVEVNAEGFHGEYPWSGTESRELVFPLQEGATAQGEGWVVVLHLGSP